MDRLELVELIEGEKAKLSPEGRRLWEDFDASLYLSPEDETELKPHEKDTIIQMAELPELDQDIIKRLTELRAGLYSSDTAERRGESGEPKRIKSVIYAAMFKDRDQHRQIDPSMTLEQAKARLQEEG
jgi:hypothetical protein